MASGSSEGKDSLPVSLDAPFVPDSVMSHDMAISNFSQVIFPDIPDFFPPESDICVTYILTEAIEPTTRDWVGLFRVGWASPRDYSTYVWSPKPVTDSRGNKMQTVSFQAYQLPGDDNEFYQFCYVTRSGYVRGASTPFQFRHSTENDCLVEVEDETGMIILKTKTDALEEKISSLNEEKASLQSNIDELCKAKEGMDKELTDVREKLNASKQVFEAAEGRNKELKTELEELSEQGKKLSADLERANSSIEQYKRSIAAADEDIATLHEEIKRLTEQHEAQLKEEINKHEEIKKQLEEREVDFQTSEREKIDLIEQIKMLTLVKNEMQQKFVTSEKTQEETLRTSAKAQDENSKKLQRYKDERNLFKEELEKSELARQETLQNISDLTEKIGACENKIQLMKQVMEEKDEKITENDKTIAEMETKHKRELTKSQDLLRNSLDRSSAANAAKQLLADELSDVTTSRDKLMKELTEIKKEKEQFSDDLKETRSRMHALKGQVETLEEKLAVSESRLIEHKKVIMHERRQAEEIEREMHEKIVIIQTQLNESDRAVAMATQEKVERSATSSALKKSRKTQTSSEAAVSVGSSDDEKTEEQKESEMIINDLRNQVSDLTTRLNMGADAYKEKFVECHKLEKKVKKLKQLYQAKQTSPRKSPSTSESVTTAAEAAGEEEPRPQGWGSKLEKLFMAIADPDAEGQEQNKQLQEKVETLQKSLETSQAKHHKYKQLLLNEKKKNNTLNEKESELSRALNDARWKHESLADENQMLKAQLKEFIDDSDNTALRNMLTYPHPDDVPTENEFHLRSPTDEDGTFEDAPGTPMYNPAEYNSSYNSSERSNSSDVSDDVGEYPMGREGAGFSNFSMCSDKSEAGEGNNPADEGSHNLSQPNLIPRKNKVISHQPIRSPPRTSDVSVTPRVVASSSHSKSSSSRSSVHRRSKRSATKKSVKGIM